MNNFVFNKAYGAMTEYFGLNILNTQDKYTKTIKKKYFKFQPLATTFLI